jgi:uncharacterized repeat protein (TIGR03803 family)
MSILNRLAAFAGLVLVSLPGLLAQSAPRATGWSESVFASFAGYNGGFAPSNLMQASDGNFYGTSAYEGVNSSGVVFQVTPAGVINPLYAFCAQTNCTDGKTPNLDLIEGPDGALYGTTSAGGDSSNHGIVFRLTLAGGYSVIHVFCSLAQCADGSVPNAGLTPSASGSFYGTTSTSGANSAGTLFSISPSGSLTVLYSFCGATRCLDGDKSNGKLIQGADGTLYGTTAGGGANNLGTLFGYNPGGTGTFTAFESFCDDSCVEGWSPNDGLTIGNDGNVYGTTSDNAANLGDGLAFQLVPATAAYNILYTFCRDNGCPDGQDPFEGLTQATDGLFYGTTFYGGPLGGEGTVYSINSSGTEDVVYNFTTTGGNGYRPATTLLQGSDGNLYGTTVDGGSQSFGAVVKLTASPALAPPVKLTPSATAVELGNKLTLAWSVADAASLTMRQCYAYMQGGSGGGSWSGKLSGTLGGASLSGSSTVSPTTNGVYTYAITCGGIQSALATVNVTNGTKANTATTFGVTPNPAVQGQQVTLSATVARELASGTPGGSVTFYYGSLALITAPVNASGVATYVVPTSDLPPGSYTLTAEYLGDSADSASVSAPQTVVVEGNTRVTLTPSPNPVTPPATVTFTATVQGFSGTPTGTVTFSIPNVGTLATVKLVNGVAALPISTNGVPAGTYTILATYNGATNFDQSFASAAVTVN